MEDEGNNTIFPLYYHCRTFTFYFRQRMIRNLHMMFACRSILVSDIEYLGFSKLDMIVTCAKHNYTKNKTNSNWHVDTLIHLKVLRKRDANHVV